MKKNFQNSKKENTVYKPSKSSIIDNYLYLYT